jgi:hypothetical protein
VAATSEPDYDALARRLAALTDEQLVALAAKLKPVKKYNDSHDHLGRFASADDAAAARMAGGMVGMRGVAGYGGSGPAPVPSGRPSGPVGRDEGGSFHDRAAALDEIDAELQNAGYISQGNGSYANQFGERIAVTPEGELGGIIATEFSTTGEAVHSEKFFSEETMRASGLFARLYVERSMMDMLAPNEPVLMKFRERVRGWFRKDSDVPLDLLDAAERAATSLLLKFSEDQARDERGRWTSGGGGIEGTGSARSAHVETFVKMGMSDKAQGQLSEEIVSTAVRLDNMLPPSYDEAVAYAKERTAPVRQAALDAAAPVAQALAEQAAQARTEVGLAVASVADQLDGTQEGLQYETKTEDSLQRKIAADSVAKSMTADAAGANIYDALRYTIVVPEGEYSTKAMAGRDMLESMGFQPVKADTNSGGPYLGYNTTWRSDSGAQFEVQFHTADSYFIKEAGNHAYYAAARVADSEPGDDVLKAETGSKMIAFGALIPIPDGMDALPTYDNR